MHKERGHHFPTLGIRTKQREKAIEKRFQRVRDLMAERKPEIALEKPQEKGHLSKAVYLLKKFGALSPMAGIVIPTAADISHHQFSPPGIVRPVSKDINTLGVKLTDRKPQIEASTQISKTATVETATVFGSQLEVNEAWLSENPQTIQRTLDITDQTGKIIKKLVVINNTLSGPQEQYKNSFLYESTFNKTTQEFEAYKPTSQVPMQEVFSIAPIENGNFILFGGADSWGSGNTTLYLYSTLDKTHTKINCPNASANLDLLKIQDNIFFANNNGGTQFILEINTATKNATVKSISLPSVGNPQISRIDTTAKTTQIISAKKGVGTSGLYATTLNYQDGTILSNENLLQTQLGRINATTQVSNTFMLAVNDIRQTIYGVDLDPVTGKPTGVSYTMPYKAWLNNAGIPNYDLDALGISAIWAKQDDLNNIHIWFWGGYTITTGRNLGVVGHFIKGQNLNIDNSLFWKHIGPTDKNTYTPFSQKEVNYKTIKGQPGFEFSVSGDNFGGERFLPTDQSYNPIPTTDFVNPDNGLQQKLYKFFVYLPITIKQYLSGW